MSKIVLFTAVSLDGFIARPDGNLDWLDQLPNPDQNDHGYFALMESIEALVMGRGTYDYLAKLGIEWPYSHLNSYIVPSEPDFKPVFPETFQMTGDIAGAIRSLRDGAQKDIWLAGGGKLVAYCLTHDLVDKMILTVIPHILGEGIRLFPGNHGEGIWWKLAGTEAFPGGAVNLIYERK